MALASRAVATDPASYHFLVLPVVFVGILSQRYLEERVASQDF